MKLPALPKIITSLLICTALLVSCGNKNSSGLKISYFAMDTLLEIDVNANLPEYTESGCREIVRTLEDKLSATVTGSEVALFNESDTSVVVSDDTAEIVRLAKRISEITSGAFDITVYPLVSLWNIAHSDESWSPPDADTVSALLPLVGSDKLSIEFKCENSFTLLKTEPGVEIELGGIGKGWAVGALAEYLSGLIDDGKSSGGGALSFGGNVAVVGQKRGGDDFIIGVKNPFDPQTLIGTLSIQNGIIAVSGGYERYVDYEGVRYQHILDPSTGRPSESDLASAAVWVSSDTPEAGALSDALSTAFFVMGSEKSLALLKSGTLEDEFGFEIGAVLVKSDGEILTTDNLSGRFTKT